MSGLIFIYFLFLQDFAISGSGPSQQDPSCFDGVLMVIPGLHQLLCLVH